MNDLTPKDIQSLIAELDAAKAENIKLREHLIRADALIDKMDVALIALEDLVSATKGKTHD